MARSVPDILEELKVLNRHEKYQCEALWNIHGHAEAAAGYPVTEPPEPTSSLPGHPHTF